MASSVANANARADLGFEGGIFSGDLYIRFKNNAGAFGKRIGPINGTTLIINPGAGDQIERISKMRGQVGQALDSIVDASTPQVTLGFDDISDELWQMIFRGVSAAINESGGTASAEAVTAAKEGWVYLANRNISAWTSLTGSGGTPTHADGTDYEVELNHGALFTRAGGAISDAASLEANYTYLGVTGYKVSGNQLDELRAEIDLWGVNRASGVPIRVHVREAVLTPDSQPDFMSSTEFVAAAFSGTAITPSGQSDPYYLERLTLATS